MQFDRLILSWAILSVGLHAQWLNYSPPGTPRLPNGKPNLSAPAPHALDGHPDLGGVWMHETTTVEEVKRLFGKRFDGEIAGSLPGMEIGTQHKYAFDILVDFTPPESGLLPAAAERYRKEAASHDPSNVCEGVAAFPFAGLLSEPIKIVQSPRETVILYEVDNMHRQIFTDGRKLPKEFELPAFLGYSTGHWERDTFLIETAGFNDKSIMDWIGHVHSDALRTTERLRRPDFGHLETQTTFDDPKTFTRPFTMKIPYGIIADNDIFEMFCNENEKDRTHLRKD